MAKPILIVRVAGDMDPERMKDFRETTVRITGGEYHVIVITQNAPVRFEVLNGEDVETVEDILKRHEA